MLRLLRLFAARFGTTDYSAKLLSALGKKAETPEVLNERELEIVRLLATGMSNKERGSGERKRTPLDLQRDFMRSYCLFGSIHWCL